MSTESITLECPVCEDSFDLEVSFTPGIEPSGMSGPPENYDPGEGPEVYLIDDIPDVCPQCNTKWTADQTMDLVKAADKAMDELEPTPQDDGPDEDDREPYED